MADDWQVGDLALCVAISHPAFAFPSTTLAVGRIYTVFRVGRPIEDLGGERALGLEGARPKVEGRGYPESLFRKVTPDTTDEFDRETIELMRGAPVGEPVA